MNQNGRAIFRCSLSSPPDASLFPTSFLSLSLFYSACLSHFKLQWLTRILVCLPRNLFYEYVICIVRNILKFPLHHNVTRVSLILFNLRRLAEIFKHSAQSFFYEFIMSIIRSFFIFPWHRLH